MLAIIQFKNINIEPHCGKIQNITKPEYSEKATAGDEKPAYAEKAMAGEEKADFVRQSPLA